MHPVPLCATTKGTGIHSPTQDWSRTEDTCVTHSGVQGVTVHTAFLRQAAAHAVKKPQQPWHGATTPAVYCSGQHKQFAGMT